MRQFGKLIIGGIQNKIFNLVLVNIIFIVAAYGIVLYNQSDKLEKLVTDTNTKQAESINTISEQTMDTVVSKSQSQTVNLEAYIADDLFSGLKTEVRMMADYAGKLLRNPNEFPKIDVKTPDMVVDGNLAAQVIYAENADPNDPEINSKVRLLGNLSEMMCSIYESSNIDAIYISTPEITIIADKKSDSKVNDEGNPVRLSAAERTWFKGAIETGDTFFTDIDTDMFTGKKYIACALPIFVDGKIEAVTGVDLFLDNMEMAVNSSMENGNFVFIVNQNGHVVFSPKKDGSLKVDNEKITDLRESDNKELAAFITDALNGKTDVKVVKVDDQEYYLSGALMKTVGWAVVSVVDKELTMQPTVMMQNSYTAILDEAKEEYSVNLSKAKLTILVLLAVILILGVLNALVLAKKIVKPLNVMAERVQKISGENLLFEMEATYETNDEIQVLAENFAALSKKTLDYIEEITKITAEKERIGAELNVATQIQADMLPRIFPPFPERSEFDLFASMNPAKEVGGDFYDYFLVDDDHIALVMADVSGKGVPAALFMVIAKTLIKNRAQLGGTPSEILGDVNNQLCEGNEAELFVTVWMAIIEISTGKGLAVNAGHEHPALKRKDGVYELIKYKHSPALAVMQDMIFKEHEFKLEPGDMFFVYTDGVAEATDKNNELFGAERMIEVLNRNSSAMPVEVLENMTNGIDDFVEDAPQFDDITMLSFRYNG